MECYLCKQILFKKIISISSKPNVEVDYGIPDDKYYREIHQCQNCGVYNNFHELICEDFYEGFYNNSITSDKFKTRFNKIINLPKESSDNKNRVSRVVKFLNNKLNLNRRWRILDIGSGTCVFLYEMKKHNVITTCIDPDSQAIKHALENVKVDFAHCGDIYSFKPQNKFDFISFNKVLEHVKNPIEIIKESLKYLNTDGVLYIELPEGDRIVNDNMIENRAEFALEHFTIYNEKSILMISKLCNLKILKSKIITDPSGKNTFYAFFKKISNE